MPAILSTLRVPEGTIVAYPKHVELLDKSQRQRVDLGYELVAGFDMCRRYIEDKIKRTRRAVDKELHELSPSLKKMSNRRLKEVKETLKEKWNRYPKRPEFRLTSKLALFVFIDFYEKNKSSSKGIGVAFVPKIMSFTNTANNHQLLFPLSRNNGGIEGKPIQVQFLFAFLAQLSLLKQDLRSVAFNHAHAPEGGSRCHFCTFVRRHIPMVVSMEVDGAKASTKVRQQLKTLICQRFDECLDDESFEAFICDVVIDRRCTREQRIEENPLRKRKSADGDDGDDDDDNDDDKEKKKKKEKENEGPMKKVRSINRIWLHVPACMRVLTRVLVP